VNFLKCGIGLGNEVGGASALRGKLRPRTSSLGGARAPVCVMGWMGWLLVLDRGGWEAKMGFMAEIGGWRLEDASISSFRSLALNPLNKIIL